MTITTGSGCKECVMSPYPGKTIRVDHSGFCIGCGFRVVEVVQHIDHKSEALLCLIKDITGAISKSLEIYI
jgi:hypothetical protein